MPVSPLESLAATRLAIQSAITAKLKAAQAQGAMVRAAQTAGVRVPISGTPSQRAAQALATIQVARAAGTQAATEVKASGGTVSDQRTAAIQAGIKAASEAVSARVDAQAEALRKAIADAQERNRSQWWYTAPWYRVWSPDGTKVPFARHDINMYNWLLKYTRANGPASFPEPPTSDLNGWGIWVQIHIQDFGVNSVPVPPTDSPLYATWHANANRGTHPGGTAGRIWTGTKEVVSKLGNILITLVGAVLAPFTGGASVLAATILVSANKVRSAAVSASSASRANSAAAAAQQADAARQAAALQKQVNDFYNNNQAWFLQHGVTPDAWAKLTLDQKVELIRAGAAGQLPVTPASDPMHDALTHPPALASGSSAAATRVPTTAGPMGPAPVDQTPNVTGSFRLDAEGRAVATAGSSREISGDVSSMTSVGDRFEIFQNGQSLGLKVRTADGAISIPADKAAQVRAMSHEDVLSLLGTASASAGASSGSGGGLLLLLALPAVAFVATKK